MTNDPFHEFVRQRQVSDLIMKRVAEHVYDRPLINNVERADYVECMVELIMQSDDPRWRLTESWDPWDVEHSETLARLEVKQSSVLQAWSRAPQQASPRFDISSSAGIWWKCPRGEFHWIETKKQRPADVYVFGWHGEEDDVKADQRNVAQWEFYVTHEQKLPSTQKSIGLNPLRKLVKPVDYTTLAASVNNALPDKSLLKTKIGISDPCSRRPT